jgi:zinc/manganese transport system substrate-binding protein
MLSRRSLLATATALPVVAVLPLRAQAGPVPVVATFSILADIVRRVGGERVAVTALVGPDGDAHSYAPTPADAGRLAAARLIVTNGLGFEGWMSRLIRSSGTRAGVVTATRGIQPLAAEGSHAHGHGHAHGAHDPHAWQDASLVKTYVANIASALAEADPGGKADFASQAAAYTAELDALHAEIRQAMAAIPRERRRILTTHDAFRYFSRAYGVDFIAVRGVSSDSEPSAREIAALIRQIRQGRITALFMENMSDPRSIERIAAETGARIGGRLYSDALSPPDGPAATYLDLMRHNSRQIAGALAQA